MDAFADILQHVVELTLEVSEIKRRLANQVRPGSVTDVDATKQLVRLDLGKDPDGKPFKSDWIPYAQIAGGKKLHLVPSVGQNMMAFSPSGDIAQAVAVPFTWSDQNPSPSTREDQVVFTFEDVRIEIERGLLRLKVGASEFELKPDTANLVSSRIHAVGATHIGVSGKDGTGAPIVTTSGPAKQATAEV